MLNLVFNRKVDKFLDKVEKEVAKRIIDSIQKLQINPFPCDVKRVENQWFDDEKVFRVRVGAYRILYAINYQKDRLLIVNIDKRSRAFD